MNEKRDDFAGQRFGCWTVRKMVEGGIARCRCACGALGSIHIRSLLDRKSLRCHKCQKKMRAKAMNLPPGEFVSQRELRKAYPCIEGCGARVRKKGTRCLWCRPYLGNHNKKFPVSLNTIAKSCGVTPQTVSKTIQRRGFHTALKYYGRLRNLMDRGVKLPNPGRERYDAVMAAEIGK